MHTIGLAPHAELRASDVAGRALALLLCVAFAPLCGLVLFWCACRGSRLRAAPRVGLHGAEFEELGLDPDAVPGRLLRALGVARWPRLVEVVRGNLALVGPRARAPGELARDDPRTTELLSVRPGLVCTWWIRRQRLIDYGSELEADLEYARHRSLRGDLGILARAVASCVAGGQVSAARKRCRILGVWTDNLSMNAALDKITELASGAPSQVCFVNADCLNLACRDRGYRTVLREATLVLADGIGVSLAGRISGQLVRQNVNGTDLFPQLCERLARDRRRVFLLGAKPGIAAQVGAYIGSRYPGLVVAGVQHGYYAPADEPALIERIRWSGADVLLVGFGAPQQDMWIRQHLQRLGVPVAIGVGGLFDFYSFTIARAPVWVRELGMEWFFRLLQEPRRLWRRYLIGNGVFLARVMLDMSRLVRYGDDDAVQA